MTSERGAAMYASGSRVQSPEFGLTSYAGAISLLHIDANHEEDSVAQDVAVWTPHIRPGGWVVLDDYLWSFGDGPKVVGDRLLEAWGEDAACAFVSGGALFIQRRPA
jgi:hypothetical protein